MSPPPIPLKIHPLRSGQSYRSSNDIMTEKEKMPLTLTNSIEIDPDTIEKYKNVFILKLNKNTDYTTSLSNWNKIHLTTPRMHCFTINDDSQLVSKLNDKEHSELIDDDLLLQANKMLIHSYFPNRVISKPEHKSLQLNMKDPYNMDKMLEWMKKNPGMSVSHTDAYKLRLFT